MNFSELPSSLDEILALPYFDLLACFGEYSLHPGGLPATARLLEASRLGPGEAVLEVGCGTGLTTHALLMAGLQVSVVDPNPRMLRATVDNCRGTGRVPRTFHTTAESMEGVPRHTFDLAIFEAVFGFLTDRRAALRSCHRALKPTSGRIAVIDFHYVEAPPTSVRKAIGEVVGHEIDVLFEKDWKDLLGAWRIAHWEVVALAPIPAPSPSVLQESLRASGRLSEVTERDLARIAERLAWHNAVFSENRRYMRAHHVVARVPWA